jgi:hypothetical protein
MHLRVLGALHRPDEERIDHRRETSGFERLRYLLAEPLTSFHLSPVSLNVKMRIMSSRR